MHEPRPKTTGPGAGEHFATTQPIDEDRSQAAASLEAAPQTPGWLVAPGHLLWVVILVVTIALGGWVGPAARPRG